MVKNKGEISINFYAFLLISRSGPGVCNEKGGETQTYDIGRICCWMLFVPDAIKIE